jgi:hypothetical protein
MPWAGHGRCAEDSAARRAEWQILQTVGAVAVVVLAFPECVKIPRGPSRRRRCSGSARLRGHAAPARHPSPVRDSPGLPSRSRRRRSGAASFACQRLAGFTEPRPAFAAAPLRRGILRLSETRRVYRAEARLRGAAPARHPSPVRDSPGLPSRGPPSRRRRSGAASFACQRLAGFTEPKLAEGERRMVDLTGIEPVTS